MADEKLNTDPDYVQEQAGLVKQIFDLCEKVDQNLLDEVIRRGQVFETTGAFTMSPMRYIQATKTNRAAADKTRALLNLVQRIQNENG
jgi:hypothetical protein